MYRAPRCFPSCAAMRKRSSICGRCPGSLCSPACCRRRVRYIAWRCSAGFRNRDRISENEYPFTRGASAGFLGFMDALTYKIIHLTGIATLAIGTGGMMADGKNRKTFAIFQGIGLLVMLVSGFGMLAKEHLGYPHFAM